MKLLIVTQVVDRDDLYLGFFHRWIEELSQKFESVAVICLREGAHDLPANVRVYSLGKEKGSPSRFAYAWRFMRLAWRLRHAYDAVFVHMNQEYVLLAGWLWRLLGKRVYMWRNHYAGSWLTDAAAAFCTKVFCTSKHSYTAKYKKTKLMPVGVDTAAYAPVAGAERKPRSVLFYARMSPSKRPDILLEALGALEKKGIDFSASFYGTPLPRDEGYLEGLKSRSRELGLAGRVEFYPGQPHAQGPAIFSAHEVFVNLGASGMYDKMLFEAAACGCLVLAASEDWGALAGGEFNVKDAQSLESGLEEFLALPAQQIGERSVRMQSLASGHSLARLARELASEMSR